MRVRAYVFARNSHNNNSWLMGWGATQVCGEIASGPNGVSALAVTCDVADRAAVSAAIEG